jgi:hypothetical protein
MMSLNEAVNDFAKEIKGFKIQPGLFDRVCYLVFQSMFDINIAKQVEKNSDFLGELLNVKSYSPFNV